MKTSTTVLTPLVCVCRCTAAQKEPAPVFACNPKAISAAERPRYTHLVKRVRAAMRERSEISNGYAFKLDSDTINLPETAEWISMERKCCPFLTLQLTATGNQSDWVLTLTGPDGVKPLLEAEFPAR